MLACYLSLLMFLFTKPWFLLISVFFDHAEAPVTIVTVFDFADFCCLLNLGFNVQLAGMTSPHSSGQV